MMNNTHDNYEECKGNLNDDMNPDYMDSDLLRTEYLREKEEKA